MFSTKKFLLFACATLFISCGKKSGSNDAPAPANVQTAQFSLGAPTYWLDEQVVVTAADKSGSTNTYSWDWGDNKVSLDNSSSSHKYVEGGTYNIKLTVNNHVYTKAVTVKSGNCSFQIKNLSNYKLINLGLLYVNQGVKLIFSNSINNLDAVTGTKNLTDTLYLTLDKTKTSDRVVFSGRVVTLSPIFLDADLPNVTIHQHTVLPVTNDTYLYYLNNQNSTTRDLLSNYLSYY
jgi:PKD repeat protein